MIKERMLHLLEMWLHNGNDDEIKEHDQAQDIKAHDIEGCLVCETRQAIVEKSNE